MACSARQHSDQMVCDKCGLQWDINDADPPLCGTGTIVLSPAEYTKVVLNYIAEDLKKPVDEIAKQQLEALESKTINDILDSLK